MTLQNAFAGLATEPKQDAIKTTLTDGTQKTLVTNLSSSPLNSGSVQALASTYTIDLTDYNSVTWNYVSGATSGPAVAFEGTLDGTSWFALFGARLDVISTAGVSTLAAGANQNAAVQFDVSGIAQMRVRATSAGAAAAAVKAIASRVGIEPNVVVTGVVTLGTNTGGIGSLTTSSSTIGSVRKTAVWYDESSTVPAANGVVTGVARDAFNAVTGTAGVGNGHDQFRALSAYDQPGTLYIEGSKDGTTNWRRIAKYAALQVDSGSGLYVAPLQIAAIFRYHRAVYVNGANVPTIAQLLSSVVS